MNNTTNIQKIRILQHNVAKSINTMISCLEYALTKNSDIILMQKSWIDDNQISISHPSFDRITSLVVSNLIDQIKFKTMTFISKQSNFHVTSKSDISNDIDVQILHITNVNIDNFLGQLEQKPPRGAVRAMSFKEIANICSSRHLKRIFNRLFSTC